VTIATDSGGRQRTHTCSLPQARRTAALAARAATWLRDEEAAIQDPEAWCAIRVPSWTTRFAVMSSLVAQVPIIWMLYLEEVLVRMECDNELIQKSLSAENPLKRHLESPIFNKGDASIPRVPGILGKA
jgi:hypothetical protein